MQNLIYQRDLKDNRKRHFISLTTALAVAGITAAIAGGTAAIVGAAGGGKGPTALPAPPTAPTAQAAEKKAEKETARRRRASLLSGGETAATSPLGARVAPGQVKQKTLLGG